MNWRFPPEPRSSLNIASAFFVTYEALKETLPRSIPILSESPSLNHMVSASGAEFVSQSSLISWLTELHTNRCTGFMFD